MTTTVVLSPADRAKLTEVNRLLTELTQDHSHTCKCELCEARWRTDTQDAPECWTVPGVTLAGDTYIEAHWRAPHGSVQVAERNPAGDDNAKLTGAGCVLTLLSVAVILVVAVPIVRWRDPVIGQPLPRTVAILAPILVGALFNGIGIILLRLAGVRVWSKSETDDSRPPKE